ncbi:DUF5683 domain-containing protein [Labilibaculum sp. DW002]|uniref:DUF5683 domain-containing protein n=1 Tax=Paralabilibaculum antarcticum TaxID=2912572 RepID=A0ABT5VSK4_9BACT|nr:DUF5683 domain-containing protein [Labilibaculum sp. DW002]MDE5418276.1 DUF5683 domain-containing protein [Labilibaculum sp. DW002]
MNNLRLIFFLGLIFLLLFGSSNNAISQQLVEADTVAVESIVKVHSPHKATMYSVMFPGLGQAYNKKYWKIPILYAGIGATIYAINWNSKNYKKYKSGFRDFSQFYDYKYQDEGLETPIVEPSSKSYEDLIDRDFSDTDQSFDNWFQTQLQNKKDSFKHDRDLSYIILLGVYVLNIVDAAVDAHFTNFSVDDNLTINVQPAVSYSAFTGNSVGFKCQITF